MKQVSKTINNIGSYFFIACLIIVMSFAAILAGIKQLIDSGLDMFNDFGTWAKEVIDPSLDAVTTFGTTILIVCFFLLAIVIVQVVFINVKNKALNFVGYLICLGFGLVMFFIGAIPFIKTIDSQTSITVVTGLLFIYTGISGTLLTVGSVVYILVVILTLPKKAVSPKKTTNQSKQSQTN